MLKNTPREIMNYVVIALGTIIMAVGIVFFLEPHTIAPGGVTGLAIVINKVAGVPIEVTNLAVNIPLFVLGLFFLGKTFGFKTAYGTIMLSLSIKLVKYYLPSDFLATHDLLLAAIFGGLLLGMGIGLIFKFGGTTGGTDLAAAIINKYVKGLGIPKIMMFIDFLILITAGIVNRNIETPLYSMIALFSIVKIADFIVEGMDYSKAFYIISDKHKEIGEAIISRVNRGATALNAKGVYTGMNKEVILCVVNRAQITKLKKTVYEIDKNAFIMVSTVHEVLGEGFTSIQE